MTSGITKKIKEQKSRKFQKELDDKSSLKKTLNKKQKETITTNTDKIVKRRARKT